jgi:hypothetical protein
MKRVVVLMFTHKAEPDAYELLSFRQCCEVLGKHPIRLVCPRGMDLSAYCAIHPDIVADFIDPKWFKSIRDYNLLKVLPWLYRRYAGYEFILTYELDAWVFRDELLDWCEQGWDYIGAPWFANYSRSVSDDEPLGVGNSGFSLRNVQSALRALRQRGWERTIFLTKGLIKRRIPPVDFVRSFFDAERFYAPYFKVDDTYFTVDDMFWHYEVAQRYPWFRLPTFEQARSFAFESNPARLYREIGCVLPFGCHKWRLREPDFWREHIPFPDSHSAEAAAAIRRS